MGKRKQQQTAAEFMAELRSNPAFREREEPKRAKRLQREQEYARLWEPLLAKLGAIGLYGGSLQEIVKRHAPLSPDAVEILLSALPAYSDPQLKQTIVRTLAAASMPFDGQPLVECYKQAREEGLKWAILNTIACARPHSIDDWLEVNEDTVVGETIRRISNALPDGSDPGQESDPQ